MCAARCGDPYSGACNWTVDWNDNRNTCLLMINNTTTKNSGLYCCDVTGQTTYQTVSSCVDISVWNKQINTTKPPPDPENNENNVPFILGLTGGGLGFLAIVVVSFCSIMICLVTFKRRRQPPPGTCTIDVYICMQTCSNYTMQFLK